MALKGHHIAFFGEIYRLGEHIQNFFGGGGVGEYLKF